MLCLQSASIATFSVFIIYFEKRKKIVKALQGVEEMRKNVDALLIENNERLCDVYADSEIAEGMVILIDDDAN